MASLEAAHKRAIQFTSELPFRDEFYADVVKSYLNDSSQLSLKLVVIGEAGQGKSSLINGLIGRKVAKEGKLFDPCTVTIDHYSLEEDGVFIEIWDTPGFGMGSVEEDKRMVETLQTSNCYPHDLALFCIRMDGTRFPTRAHIDTIQTFTRVFGKEFWKHTVFILTFANNIVELCDDRNQLRCFFISRVGELTKKIKETLKIHVNMSVDELEAVRTVPVGSYKGGLNKNPWALPDREDWFVWFWIECTDHMRQISLPALLKLNKARIVNEIAPEYGQSISPSNLHTHELSEHVKSSPGDTVDEKSLKEDQSDILGQSILNQEPNSGNVLQNSHDLISIPANENLTDRNIPFYPILNHQLDNENSSFNAYIKEYIRRRENTIWGVRHVAGFMEGLIAWIRRQYE